MASELKVNTLTGVSTAGSIAVTAEGNSTTTNLQQGLIKYWVNYNHLGDAVRDSFNSASKTDHATGDFSIGMTNAMSSSNYSTTFNSTAALANSRGGSFLGHKITSYGTCDAQDLITSSTMRMCSNFGSSSSADGNDMDFSNACIQVSGDLA